MLTLTDGSQVYLSLMPVDMRKSINGLSVLVFDALSKSPQSGDVFIFYNKTKNKVKLLFWDRNGFVLYYKRLERGKFKFSQATEGVIELHEDQLSWLLAGLDFQLMQEFSDLNYSDYY